MNETRKLEEAKYFYSKMVNEKKDKNAFSHNLSAFLSATRSVLQYAEAEAKTKSGGKIWYDKVDPFVKTQNGASLGWNFLLSD